MEGGTSISATNTSEKRKIPPHISSQGEEDSRLGPRQIKYPRLVHPVHSNFQCAVPSTTSTTDYNCNNVLVVTRSRRPFEIESPPNKRWDDKPFRGQEVKAASTATASATTQTNCAASTSTSTSGGVGTFQCASCGCKFVRDYQLWWHWRDHIPRRDRHLCHLCPFVSNEANSLKQHVHRCHETPLGGVACNVCQGAFVAKDRDDLSRHIFRSHMFDKRFFLTRPIKRIKSVPLLPTTQSTSLRLMMSSTASLTTPTRSAIF